MSYTILVSVNTLLPLFLYIIVNVRDLRLIEGISRSINWRAKTFHVVMQKNPNLLMGNDNEQTYSET